MELKTAGQIFSIFLYILLQDVVTIVDIRLRQLEWTALITRTCKRVGTTRVKSILDTTLFLNSILQIGFVHSIHFHSWNFYVNRARNDETMYIQARDCSGLSVKEKKQKRLIIINEKFTFLHSENIHRRNNNVRLTICSSYLRIHVCYLICI